MVYPTAKCLKLTTMAACQFKGFHKVLRQLVFLEEVYTALRWFNKLSHYSWWSQAHADLEKEQLCSD
jgi:hypothetical protein